MSIDRLHAQQLLMLAKWREAAALPLMLRLQHASDLIAAQLVFNAQVLDELARLDKKETPS